VEEGEAVRWIASTVSPRRQDRCRRARELVDALGGDMMMVSNELEK